MFEQLQKKRQEKRKRVLLGKLATFLKGGHLDETRTLMKNILNAGILSDYDLLNHLKREHHLTKVHLRTLLKGIITPTLYTTLLS